MNREQWEALARFAGVDENTRNYGWYPRTDWNDFGPLLVLLHHWRSAGNYFHGTPKYLALPMECREAMIALDVAETTNDQQRWMQAGCALGAAIGATMGDKA